MLDDYSKKTVAFWLTLIVAVMTAILSVIKP